MRLRERRHDWRSSCGSPVQPGLIDHFIHNLIARSRRRGQSRLAHLVVVVLVTAILVLLVIALGLVLWLRRLILLVLGSRNPAQITHSRFDLVHQADVLVVTDYPRLSGVVSL